ncbi:MAG: hypothetical protein PVSMB2_38400 [Ktedonobacteraceae bacterium]
MHLTQQSTLLRERTVHLRNAQPPTLCVPVAQLVSLQLLLSPFLAIAIFERRR